MPRVAVIRTLLIRGEKAAVDAMLAKSWVSPDHPQQLPNLSVVEIARSEEPLDAPGEIKVTSGLKDF